MARNENIKLEEYKFMIQAFKRNPEVNTKSVADMLNLDTDYMVTEVRKILNYINNDQLAEASTVLRRRGVAVRQAFKEECNFEPIEEEIAATEEEQPTAQIGDDVKQDIGLISASLQVLGQVVVNLGEQIRVIKEENRLYAKDISRATATTAGISAMQKAMLDEMKQQTAILKEMANAWAQN